METLPPDAFLEPYPDGIRRIAAALRQVVRDAVPDAVERVRTGWRLIGYEVSHGRRLRYFAYVAPETEHVHLGFEYGAWVRDPQRLLEGAHLNLRQVRYTTFRPGDGVPHASLVDLTREAARVAGMSPEQRLALALDGEETASPS